MVETWCMDVCACSHLSSKCTYEHIHMYLKLHTCVWMGACNSLYIRTYVCKVHTYVCTSYICTYSMNVQGRYVYTVCTYVQNIYVCTACMHKIRMYVQYVCTRYVCMYSMYVCMSVCKYCGFSLIHHCIIHPDIPVPI